MLHTAIVDIGADMKFLDEDIVVATNISEVRIRGVNDTSPMKETPGRHK